MHAMNQHHAQRFSNIKLPQFSPGSNWVKKDPTLKEVLIDTVPKMLMPKVAEEFSKGMEQTMWAAVGKTLSRDRRTAVAKVLVENIFDKIPKVSAKYFRSLSRQRAVPKKHDKKNKKSKKKKSSTHRRRRSTNNKGSRKSKRTRKRSSRRH